MDFNFMWMDFLKTYNWTRVALLFQDASSGYSAYAYVSFILSHNVNVRVVCEASWVEIIRRPLAITEPDISLKIVAYVLMAVARIH